MSTTERDYLSGLLTHEEYIDHMLARYGAVWCVAHSSTLAVPIPIPDRAAALVAA